MNKPVIETLSPAKLNLFLHVLGQRADGYHELQTVFQLLDWGDVMRFEVTDTPGVQLTGDVSGVPYSDNLIVSNHCFFSNAKAPEKYLFNLPGYGLFRLRKAGIKAAEWTQYCTYSDPKRFFSYRRATHQKQADYWRLISTIRLS